MAKNINLDGLEAACRLASLSPETQAKFDECMALRWSKPEQVTMAFHAIGAAIGSKRSPVSSSDKRKLFEFAEKLLTQGSPEVSNAVATCMLESLLQAVHESGFEFETVDAYLGQESRGYLIAWDDFLGRNTKGLTRK